MRRRAVAIVIGLLAASACGSASSGPPGAAPTPAELSWLTVADVCDGGCAYVLPAELPAVAAYADGSVLSPRRDERGDPVFPIQLVTSPLSEAGWKAVTALAAAAGLPDRAIVPTLPGGMAIADGGEVVFRTGGAGGPTTLRIPNLSSRDAPLRPVAAKQSLLALHDALEDATGRGAAYTPGEYALLADRSAANDGQDAMDYALPAAGPGSTAQRRCSLLTGDQASGLPAAIRTARGPFLVKDSGAAWLVQLRPLLPHEVDCSDLVSSLD